MGTVQDDQCQLRNFRTIIGFSKLLPEFQNTLFKDSGRAAQFGRANCFARIFSRFEFGCLAKGTDFLDSARPIGVFIVAAKGNSLAKTAIQALEFPGMDLQIILVEVIVLALQCASFFLVWASISAGSQWSRHVFESKLNCEFSRGELRHCRRFLAL